MTGKTDFIQLYFFLHWLSVAGETYQFFMRAFQSKLGLLIMIKLPELPALGVMTGITFRPQALLMNIDLHMAIHTFRRSVLILR